MALTFEIQKKRATALREIDDDDRSHFVTSSTMRSSCVWSFLWLLTSAAAFAPQAAGRPSKTELGVNPFQAGKFALVKSLAGDYDRAAVQARLNGLIDDSPVLMLSFVK